jgi:hypothetical protein
MWLLPSWLFCWVEGSHLQHRGHSPDPGIHPKGHAHFFHLCAWGWPALKTIAVLTTDKVEGDTLSGLCYVGVHDVDALR